MQGVEIDCKLRKWFEKWRSAFKNRTQDNYLNEAIGANINQAADTLSNVRIKDKIIILIGVI